jgi:hypothetical protein
MAKFTGKPKGLWEGLDPTDKDVSVHDDTHTHEHDDVVVAKPKQIKNKRIQILTYGTLVRRMDAYAKRNALSRAEVFEKAVTEFLERNT